MADFEFNRDALVGEVERYLKGAAPGEASLLRAVNQISANSTPAEIRAVLYKISEVMNGKTKGYVSDWNKVFGNTGAEIPINEMPHKIEENERIEKMLHDQYLKSSAPKEEAKPGVTAAPPQQGDRIERNGATYEWNAETNRYHRVKE